MSLKPFGEQYQKRVRRGVTGDECCLCGRPTAGAEGALHVPVDHTVGEFVTEAQVASDPAGERISLYPIGPECARKWRREFDAEAAFLARPKTHTVEGT